MRNFKKLFGFLTNHRLYAAIDPGPAGAVWLPIHVTFYSGYGTLEVTWAMKGAENTTVRTSIESPFDMPYLKRIS